jgi:hypothetical protein
MKVKAKKLACCRARLHHGPLVPLHPLRDEDRGSSPPAVIIALSQSRSSGRNGSFLAAYTRIQPPCPSPQRLRAANKGRRGLHVHLLSSISPRANRSPSWLGLHPQPPCLLPEPSAPSSICCAHCTF